MAENDLVQEQMGDILTAFDIPDLAKHIVPIPIPLDPLDFDEDEEQKEGDQKEGETNGETRKERDGEMDGNKEDSATDLGDSTAKDGGNKGNEATNSVGEEDKDGNIEEDASMETDEGTSAGPEQGDSSQGRDTPNLDLKRSSAPLLEAGLNYKESSVIKELLMKSSSKPVMTSRLQDSPPHPAPADTPHPAAGDAPHPLPDPDGDTDDADVEEVPPLMSADEFSAWVDRCKEGTVLKDQKLSILSKTSSISTYKCPKLTDEQLEVLDMDEAVYKCPGCDDTYLFKASLDAHLDRRTIMVTFHCKWCKRSQRRDLVFYNKCTFLAHLLQHRLYHSEIEKVILDATVCPVNALNALKIYTKLTAPKKRMAPRAAPKQSSQLTAQEAAQEAAKQAAQQAAEKAAQQMAQQMVQPELPQIGVRNDNPGQSLLSNKPVTIQAESKPPDSVTLALPTKPATELKNEASGVNNSSAFSCLGCCRRYDRLNNLRTHLSRPQPDPTKTGADALLTCSCCKLVVANRCKLIMHHIIHQRVKESQQPCPCPECGILFTDVKSLLIHQNDGCYHWMTRPLFKCSFCTKYATTFAGLVRHLEQNHVGVFYKCPLCQLAFRNNQSAAEHSAKVHKLKSVTYGVLRKCPFCKSVYSERGMLVTHFESHGLLKTEKFVFCCPLCMKPFDYGIGLRNHLESEHGRTNKNLFHCDRCVTAFSTIDAVMVHRLTCPSKPTEHIKINRLKPPKPPPSPPLFKATHTDKQFVCAECGERFHYSDLEGLRKHMVEKHNVEMKDSSAGTSRVPGSTTKKLAALNKAQNNPETEKPPEVAKKEAPVTVERFTDLQCGKCQFKASDRLVFEKHIAGYKTEDSLSQCHECGLCFTVGGSLKKHLFIKHKIKNMAAYNSLYDQLIPKWEDEMKKKKLEEKEKESAKAPVKEESSDAPMKEAKDVKMEDVEEEEESNFKCKVCKAEFVNDKALTVHARSHGLAYLQHTLAKSPEKTIRMQSPKPASAPIKEETKSPTVKPLVIPSDTDSSTTMDSDEASSVDED